MSEPGTLPDGLRVCVVGCGVAGRLHRTLLEQRGATTRAVDTGPIGAGAAEPGSWPDLDAVPRDEPVDVWSVCTPTASHLETVRRLLERDPAARIIVEKPLCRPSEIDAFLHLLRRYPRCGVVLVDQYRHAVLPRLTAELLADRGWTARTVRVAFTKDRREDARLGRFVDRDYGVLGYEWLHMMAVLRGALTPPQWDAYVRASPADSRVECAVGDGLAQAACETTELRPGPRIEMFSTVVGSAADEPGWLRDRPTGPGGRRRILQVDTGAAVLTSEFDPVVDDAGTYLGRNQHRVTLAAGGRTARWTVEDSPMATALVRAVADLYRPGRPPLDLAPMRRLSALADLVGARVTARPATVHHFV